MKISGLDVEIADGELELVGCDSIIEIIGLLITDYCGVKVRWYISYE